MNYPENFEVMTPSEQEFNEVWNALVKAQCAITVSSQERVYRGIRTRIKRSSTMDFAWASVSPGGGVPKPVYSVAEFKAAFPALFEQKATMDDLIRMVSLDQELGCMQAEMDNLQGMIDEKQRALVAMQKKFNITP